MTTYTWTDNAMQGGSACDVDKVNDNLMHLKYNAGGLLPINDLGTKTSNFTLEPNKIDVADITASLTISLPTTGFISGVENKCILDFTTTSASSPTLPTGLKWKGGFAPSSFTVASSVRNILMFTTRDAGTTWEAEYSSYGGYWSTFTQPTLSANGTLGGANFAVWASAEYSGYPAYYAVDGTTNYWKNLSSNPTNYILYNPDPVMVTSISITNCYNYNGNYQLGYGSVYGSNDNSTYTTLVSSFGNSSGTASATWSIPIPAENQAAYKYYKIVMTANNASGSEINIGNIGLVGTIFTGS